MRSDINRVIKYTCSPEFLRALAKLGRTYRDKLGRVKLDADDPIAVIDLALVETYLQVTGGKLPLRVPKRGGKRRNAGRPKSDANTEQ